MDSCVYRNDVNASSESRVVLVEVMLHPVLKITVSPAPEVHDVVRPIRCGWSLLWVVEKLPTSMLDLKCSQAMVLGCDVMYTIVRTMTFRRMRCIKFRMIRRKIHPSVCENLHFGANLPSGQVFQHCWISAFQKGRNIRVHVSRAVVIHVFLNPVNKKTTSLRILGVQGEKCTKHHILKVNFCGMLHCHPFMQSRPEQVVGLLHHGFFIRWKPPRKFRLPFCPQCNNLLS
jgi:hypothetical protein